GSCEKISEFNLPVVLTDTSNQTKNNIAQCVEKALLSFSPDIVLDLSDQPVLSFADRMQLANLILSKGVSYKGADFLFEAKKTVISTENPAISIEGLSKRAGKTAAAATAAKFISKKFKPIIITMGRGGPEKPELIEGDKIKITPEFLLEQSVAGKHAGGDNYENALIAQVPVIGCRRAGGGFTGAVFYSTVREGALLANSLNRDFQIYVGSGTTSPPVQIDARIIIISAYQSPDNILDGFGALRIKEADTIVITGCESPPSKPDSPDRIEKICREINPEARVIQTIFRPQPLGSIKNKRVVFATTAPKSVLPLIVRYLEETYSCNIGSVISSLSNREKLSSDLEKVFLLKTPPEVLLTELKAASVDVGVRSAIAYGINVVFCHNSIIEKEGGRTRFSDEIKKLMTITVSRFKKRR
ncbi:MAG: 2,3-diphosphoglycerate synthetase, partial [Planctomycetota bacterium]